MKTKLSFRTAAATGLLATAATILCNTEVNAQGLGFNNSNPHASALLDMTSTTRGLLVPRMTTAQRDAIASPATGLMVYNTNTNRFNVYNGTSWTSSIGGAWTTSGNYVYTSTSGDSVGIGTTSPGAKLSVNGDISNGFPLSGNINTGGEYQLGGWATIFNPSGGNISFGGKNASQWTIASFWTNANERMRIDASGNVGIGTTAPTWAKLDIQDSSTVVQVRSSIPAIVTGYNNGGAIYFGVDNTNSATTPTGGIETSWEGGTTPSLGIGLTRGGLGPNILMRDPGGGGSGSINFRDGTTSNMYIDGVTGNVGIGTEGPTSRLEVRAPNSVTAGTHEVSVQANLAGTGGVATGWYADGASVTGGWMRSINSLPFFIGTAGATQAVTISNGGNVGIGTTAPTRILGLGGEANRTIGMERRTVSAAGLSLTVNAGGAFSGSTNLNGGNLTLVSGISTGTGISSIFFQTATSGTTGTVDNNPTTKMAILGNGNVGIGNTTPQWITDIIVPGSTSGTGLNIRTPIAGNATGYLRFTNTTNNDASGAYSSFIGGERVTASGHSLVFGTAAAIGGTPTEKMRIDGNGNVGIGTTSPQSMLHIGNGGELKVYDTGTRYARLFHSAAGNLHLDAFGGGTAYINWYGSTGGLNVGNGAGGYGPAFASAFTVSSSKRFKKDIVNTHYGLAEILMLQGKEFKYINDQKNHKEVGFIAEEMNLVIPEIVYSDTEGQITGIDYSKLSPVLVEAIKDQQKMIDSLKQEVGNLQKEHVALKSENAIINFQSVQQQKEIERIKEYLELKSSK